MFDNFTEKKQRGFRFKVLAIGSGALHVAVGATFIVMGMWQINEISRPNRGLAMAATFQPAPSGGSGPKAVSEPTKAKITKVIVKERRQPTNKQSDKADHTTQSISSGDDGGGGTGSGPGNEVGNGSGTGPAGIGPGGNGLNIEFCFDADNCDQPTVPKATIVPDAPKHVAPAVLRAMKRLSGDAQIQPPSSTQNSMSLKHEDEIITVIQLCVDTSGSVSRQKIAKSSGYHEYDAKLLSGVRRWRYQPYQVNGRSTAICTQVRFVYRQ